MADIALDQERERLLSQLASHDQEPNILEKLIQLVGGRPKPAPSAGATGNWSGGYGQNRATPEELIAMAQSGGRNGGPQVPLAVGSRPQGGGGGAGGNIGMRELNALMQQIIASGAGKGAIAREAAGKMKMPEEAKDSEAYAALLANNTLAKGNPMDVIVRQLAGGFVDPNSDNPFGKFGERATAAVTADEVKCKGDRERALLEGVTGMKFGASDRASRDARAEAMNKQTGAIADADAMAYGGIEKAASEGMKQVPHMMQINEAARARREAVGRGSLPNQVKEYVATMQEYGDKRDATAIAQEFMRKAREQKPEKFDDKEVEFAQQGVVAALSSVKDPEKRKQLLAAWQQDVLETKDPVVSTRKLLQVINAPVGK